MRSPFPGMDPYLEDPGFWPDFHARFVTYCCDHISDNLPARYEARIGERINLVEREPDRIKRIGPDIAIARKTEGPKERSAAGMVATLEPVTIPLTIEEESRETYVEILHRPERSLVCAIELLSPSNKEAPGRRLYLAKRNALLLQPVHLLELDLLMAGRRLPTDRPLPSGDYHALVARGERRPDCDVFSWDLERPLPTIPVPLRAPDPDIRVDLAAVFGEAYRRGRYAVSVQYEADPPVAVHATRRRWIRERVESWMESRTP